MKNTWTNKIVATSALLLASGLCAFADGPRFRATLNSTEQVPEGRGTLTLTMINDGTALAYKLTYSPLDSRANVSVIQVANHTAVVLCGAGEDRQACPAAGGTVTGIISAESIRAVPAAALAPEDFKTFVQLLRTGAATAMVHDVDPDNGDIRGTIHPVDE